MSTLDWVIAVSLGVAALGILVLLLMHRHGLLRRDSLRFFPWHDKKALIAQAGGRCEHKPPLWRRCPNPGTEADHIIPWSKGGPTVLWNGQLLCHKHNQRKSNLMPPPGYRWRLAARRRRYRHLRTRHL